VELFGLHVLDCGIIVVYVLAILWVGRWAGRRTKNTSDFYLAGRRLGKFYQFFLNFGTSTNADQAVGVSREIYRQGIGGMWIQYLVLFLTPFYWFTTMLFRRCRLMTMGELFTERFESRFLGGAFAAFTLTMTILGGGASYMVAGKTMMALTPKPEARYSEQERACVERFCEYRALEARRAGGLASAEQARYEELHERLKRGELRSFISYTDPVAFYVMYAVIVATYTVLGGFTAAALTDAIQGFLILVFSCLLIPAGLRQVGGFSGLHAAVPDYMFELFGSAATSEYAWYTILAMVLANLVSIVAAAPMMATAGSAKDESTARFGMLGGMYVKRFVMLFWALTGLLAIALYGGALDDPDLIWGHMTHKLLFPGAIGLMLAGVWSANMSALAASAVTGAALFVRNLYEPLVPGRSERHCINVGRVAIVAILAGGILSAVVASNLLHLFKYFIALPAVFGAPIWLAFVWRRLTRWAVIIQVFVCFTLYAIIPNLFPNLDVTRRHPALLRETRPQEATIQTGALAEDVAAGWAQRVGQVILKPHYVAPAGIFFDNVVRVDPADPDSPRIGQGRFAAEVWVLSWLGLDFSGCTRAQLVAVRFAFDALFPFVLLFGLSALTRSARRENLDRFYGKLHTPVQPSDEQELAALERAAASPEIFNGRRLWPRSSWELLKPGRSDILGFGGCWLLVGVLLVLLWLLTRLGT
jgi:SSS family solute:Na+ symporter